MPRNPGVSARMKRRFRQADRIEEIGHIVGIPCERCFLRGASCVMDSKSRNCSSCTRYGRKCEKRFHSDKEWSDLESAESQIQEELRLADLELERLQSQLQSAFAKHARLRRHQKFLKERGSKMLDHDSNVLDRLDEENPLSAEELQELERFADEREAAQLVTVSDNPSFTQMINSPSFWENFDSTVAGGIPSPSGGNPSNSR